jgi:hypothetical protein
MSAHLPTVRSPAVRSIAFALALSLLPALSSGCSYTRLTKRLSDAEFDHYYALRVYMDEDQRKEYLKLKTQEERDQWLRDAQLWDRFYQYDERTRDRIVEGAVAVGWTLDQVYMAWGKPIDRKRMPGRKATRSELLVYKFEEHRAEDGSRSAIIWVPGSKTAYQADRFFIREVLLDDDVVAEIAEKDSAG